MGGPEWRAFIWLGNVSPDKSLPLVFSGTLWTPIKFRLGQQFHQTHKQMHFFGMFFHFEQLKAGARELSRNDLIPVSLAQLCSL